MGAVSRTSVAPEMSYFLVRLLHSTLWLEEDRTPTSAAVKPPHDDDTSDTVLPVSTRQRSAHVQQQPQGHARYEDASAHHHDSSGACSRQ